MDKPTPFDEYSAQLASMNEEQLKQTCLASMLMSSIMASCMSRVLLVHPEDVQMVRSLIDHSRSLWKDNLPLPTTVSADRYCKAVDGACDSVTELLTSRECRAHAAAYEWQYNTGGIIDQLPFTQRLTAQREHLLAIVDAAIKTIEVCERHGPEYTMKAMPILRISLREAIEHDPSKPKHAPTA